MTAEAEMIRTFIAVSAIVFSSVMAAAQASGNIGYSQSSGSSRARQAERNKRVPVPGETHPSDGMFLEASVLMNVPADEYVAVFGVSQECVTVAECGQKIDAVTAEFSTAVQQLGISRNEINVDFATQNRIYEFKITGDVAKEELTGFEVKKNVAIHYRDKHMLDKLIVAASRSKIFDLIKVDYLVKDQMAVENRLMEEAARIIKQKASRYEQLLGVKLDSPVRIYAEKPSIYFPIEMYDSYTAQESESLSNAYERDRGRYAVQGARKSRTFFFNPLTADGFDYVINPVVVEPVVQFTLYLKVIYGSDQAKAAKP
jgi:uncharacterized protein YggE